MTETELQELARRAKAYIDDFVYGVDCECLPNRDMCCDHCRNKIAYDKFVKMEAGEDG